MTIRTSSDSAYFGSPIDIRDPKRDEGDLGWRLIDAAREGNDASVQELLKTRSIAKEYLDSAVRAARERGHADIAEVILQDISDHPPIRSESPGKGRQAKIIASPKKAQETVEKKSNSSAAITGVAIATIAAVYAISFFI